MRRTPPWGLALAFVLALVVVPSASASPLLTLRDDGTTFARDDRLLPPAGVPPAAPSSRPTTGGPAGLRAGAAAKKLTVRGELQRLLAAGAIDQATYDEQRAIYVNALAFRAKLSGTRRAAMGAVLSNLEAVAAAGGLTATRLPALFATVARNRQWWSNGPLLNNGARVSFQGSRLVWQYYAGEGLQIQWLGTFGKANGLWQGGFETGLREILDESLALASARAGGIAWEYLFDFDGGRPPWVSGLAQGTAIQALARAGQKLADPRYADAARTALGIFREAPPSGVRVATPAGAHYLIYSFAPGMRVLNAFTQAINGLHDLAKLAGDAEAQGLYTAGETQLRAELPAYDTGAWSRYSQQREADLSYHTLARDFLRGLCTRLTEDAAPVPAPGVASTPAGGTPVAGAPSGGVVPVPGAVSMPVLDPAPYCGAADRWTTYLKQPPVVKLVSRRARGGKPASLKVSVSKPAYVTLKLRRGGSTRLVLGGSVASGVRALRWPSPPRDARSYDVVLGAKDLAGNVGSGTGTLKLLKAKRAKG